METFNRADTLEKKLGRLRRLFVGVAIAGSILIPALIIQSQGHERKLKSQFAAEKAAMARVLATYADLRQAPDGDKATDLVIAMQNQIRAGGLGDGSNFSPISVKVSELQQVIEDKYFADSKRQLAIMRNPKTGPEAAQVARSEFYRTQKLSGRGLVSYPITAMAIDGFVRAAHSRAAGANFAPAPRKMIAKKAAPKRAIAKKSPAKKSVIRRTATVRHRRQG